jgi:Uma2 family endonuclease
MTGGSRAHQRIVGNLLRLLDDHLDPDRFDAIQEMRIYVGGKIRYPDLLVVAPPVNEDTRTLLDAVVIFEVLSEDTADRTLGQNLPNTSVFPLSADMWSLSSTGCSSPPGSGRCRVGA